MIVLGFFQLNPGLANTVGALRRKPHVEKIYRDLAAISFECQRFKKIKTVTFISPVILEKRPSYSDSCQSCCVPKPTAVNKCKILTISNSNKKNTNLSAQQILTGAVLIATTGSLVKKEYN